MRDSFIFYRSFFETIQKLNKRDRLSLVEAICNYALNDIEPEALTGTSDAVFTLLKPQLDANTRKYENGLKGGRPKETKQKPKQNQTKSKPKRNDNDNVNDNVNDNDNGLGFENEPSGTSPSSIIKYLNLMTGADYDLNDEYSHQLVNDLISQGYDYNDLMRVVNNKCAEWLNDKAMRSYLRPSTLFGPKFAEYLAAPEPIQAETERKKTDELKDVKKQLSAKRRQLISIRADMNDPELIEESTHDINSRFYNLRDQEAIIEDAISRLEMKVAALGG